MPIGITLFLIVREEQQNDTHIFSVLPSARYHLIHKETRFPVVFANLCYYKFARIKTKVIKYCTTIPYILYRTIW